METENTKTNSKLTKSIGEIAKPDFHFLIPSYQRGYRWKKEHVESLLSDILTFHKKDKNEEGEFYCLQPVVVKKRHQGEWKGKWEVIDGQQRLTTIFLILKYIINELSQKTGLFEIHYDTVGREKDKDFLEKLDPSKKDENIDYFHIYEAHQSIEEWFRNQTAETGTIEFSSFLYKLLSTISDNVEIIWYEIEDEQDGREVFTRLNTGKIPLTNSELIKALFLHSKNFEKDTKLNSLELSGEWDRIEYTLQDDGVWGFLGQLNNKRDNRIEYLFTLLSPDKLPGGDYALFNHYNEKHSTGIREDVLEEWQQVKNNFMRIEEWYKDHALYHHIGYLMQIGISLKEICRMYEGKNKSDFKESLKELIKEKLKLEDINSYEYGSEKVGQVLLLFNIEQHIRSYERFSFHAYNEHLSSIEHIRARHQEDAGKKNREWIEDHIASLNRCYPNDSNDPLMGKLISIKKLIDTDTKSGISKDMQKSINQLSEEVIKKYGEEEYEDINNIWNLCLLDQSSNSSLSNGVFDVKRAKIIKMQNDKYIPLATRRVFLKYYSKMATSLFLWEKSDGENYMDAMQEALKFYFKQPKEE